MTDRDISLELWRVMEALADSTEGATADELAEALGLGEQESRELAEDTRNLLLSSVSRFKKRRLADTREAYEASVVEYRSKVRRVPSGATGRMRDLLESVFKAEPELQLALTAQFRDFGELSDADVESAVQQLVALGVLDESDLRRPEEED